MAVPTDMNAGVRNDVVLEVEHLSLDFRLRQQMPHAVRDVSFVLRRGETLCLVGESGSGKAAAVRALLRILNRNGTIVAGRRNHDREIDIAALSERSQELLRIRDGWIGLTFREPDLRSAEP